MLELVKYVVEAFAEKKEAINYDVTDNGKTAVITVSLDPSDMGKVIGRKGKIAKALRVIVKNAALKENKKYNIEIKENGAE